MNKKMTACMTERIEAAEANAAHAALLADLVQLKLRQEPKHMDALAQQNKDLNESLHAAYALIEQRAGELRALIGGALERIERIERRLEDKEAKA